MCKEHMISFWRETGIKGPCPVMKMKQHSRRERSMGWGLVVIYPDFGKGRPKHEMGYVCVYEDMCADVCASVGGQSKRMSVQMSIQMNIT